MNLNIGDKVIALHNGKPIRGVIRTLNGYYLHVDTGKGMRVVTEDDITQVNGKKIK